MNRLLPKVVRAAMGTLVWQCELRLLLDSVLTVDVVTHTRWGIAVDVVRVVLWPFPERISGKVHNEGMSTPATPERRALHSASRHLTSGDLVMDVGQYVEHLAAVRHGV